MQLQSLQNIFDNDGSTRHQIRGSGSYYRSHSSGNCCGLQEAGGGWGDREPEMKGLGREAPFSLVLLNEEARSSINKLLESKFEDNRVDSRPRRVDLGKQLASLVPLL